MSRIFRTKENYIGLLKACEMARPDFGDLKYCRNHRGEEYLVLQNVIGNTFMFDITGYDNAQIKHTLAMIECGKEPTNFIKDQKKMLEIAKLYYER